MAVTKHPQKLFDTHMLLDEIDGTCEQWEVDRLREYYKSYERPHRTGFLRTLLDGSLHTALAKVQALGIKPEELTPQQWGTHTQWIGFKYRRLAIRILYLRMTLGDAFEGKLQPKEARHILLGKFKKWGINTYDAVYRATKFKVT